jgi:hypothetical protein
MGKDISTSSQDALLQQINCSTLFDIPDNPHAKFEPSDVSETHLTRPVSFIVEAVF